MEFVHKNPFRILGLPVTASEREISKRVSDLEMYLEMGKPVYYDMDFPALSPIERSLESVSQAVNQIESDKSRLYYSTFWFWNNNTTDELALDVLKEGKIDTAIRLMEKQLSSGNGKEKSFSTTKNLSVLYMALALNNNSFLLENFSNSLKYANNIFNDKHFSMFAEKLPGRMSLIEKNAIINYFVDDISRHLLPFLDKDKGISLKQLIASFSSISEETRNKVANRFISIHVKAIEDAIKLSEKEREKNPNNAKTAATNLWKSIRHPLTSIQNAVGKEDYIFQAISDKLANELEVCSTYYYNYHCENETGFDPGEATLKISEYARTLATSISTQRRIDEGIDIVKRWIDGKADREIQNIIRPHYDFIVKALNNTANPDEINEKNCTILVQSSQNLLEKCKPHLEKIKSQIGSNSNSFIDISSAVASQAMNIVIAYANISKDSSKALEIFKMLSQFSMNLETTERYRRNKSIFERNVQFNIHINIINKLIEKANSAEITGIKSFVAYPTIIKELIDSALPHLENIKSLDYDLYIALSSAVANTAINISIEFANRYQSAFEVLLVFRTIERLDMDAKTLNRYNTNKSIISSNASTKVSNSVDRFCYIATMVYGDRNSPEVIVLRKFRDDVLYKSKLGTFLVKTYYALSPFFVKYFGKYTVLHRPIKCLLDYIVRKVA